MKHQMGTRIKVGKSYMHELITKGVGDGSFLIKGENWTWLGCIRKTLVQSLCNIWSRFLRAIILFSPLMLITLIEWNHELDRYLFAISGSVDQLFSNLFFRLHSLVANTVYDFIDSTFLPMAV